MNVWSEHSKFSFCFVIFVFISLLNSGLEKTPEITVLNVGGLRHGLFD